MNHLKAIAFDADDTLWHTENLFQDVQAELSSILDQYAPHDEVQNRLHQVEMKNITLFGYGVKGFTLSMVETAIEISEQKVTASDIRKIVMLGKGILDSPLTLIHGVRSVLEALGQHYRLFLITKGDVLDQTNKISKSGLEDLFEHTEVVQEKDVNTYATLFGLLDVEPENLAMVGNSMKSDIMPVLELGGAGIYIPYQVTARFEVIDENVAHGNLYQLNQITELPELLKSKSI